MKVLDRYLIRELLMPILCCCITLIFLILIADLFDNLTELLNNKTPPLIIARYYLNLTPYAFSETISWATWLGTVFLLVNFGLHNETIAMKVAGLKIFSIVRPLLLVGLLIGLITFVANDYVVPKTLRTANDLREIYIENRKPTEETKFFHNVTFYSGGNRIYYYRKFLPSQNEVRDVIVLWVDPAKGNTRQKMIAEKGTWHDGKWKYEKVTEYRMDFQGKILGEPRTFPEKIYPHDTVTPKDLISASSESAYLSYRDLKHSVKKLTENGINVDSEKVALHNRLAAPWRSLIVMLISIPLLAPTRNRKAIAGSILLCVLCVFSYHVTESVSLALGKAGKLFPFASAWGANILFAIGALFYLDKANY